MANEMPRSDEFDGLSRKVIAYSEAFASIVRKAGEGTLGDADWAEIERLVDTAAFTRVGIFLGPKAETIDWPTYRRYVTDYAGRASWEGTLRHITEQGRRVILELEERNTVDGVLDVSNTVTTYQFDDEDRLKLLEVYIMHLG